ncbi:NAD(P)H-binding protein [Streptomyces sp. ISL-10]|nr:NAD(P)H-binding protein [Streptomyces sp. ISL-10]
MDTVLVTGGTGHLGRDLIGLLKPGYRVRVLARSRGTDPDVEWVRGDLAAGAGAGIREAVSGVRTVVHAATWSPAARRGYLLPTDFWRSPPDVDVHGTHRLLDEAARAGVGHFAYVSIVGVDRPRLPYLRLKHEAEELVRAGKFPGRCCGPPSSTGWPTACWARLPGFPCCRCPRPSRPSRLIPATSPRTWPSASPTGRAGSAKTSAGRNCSPSATSSRSGSRSAAGAARS